MRCKKHSSSVVKCPVVVSYVVLSCRKQRIGCECTDCCNTTVVLIGVVDSGQLCCLVVEQTGSVLPTV